MEPPRDELVPHQRYRGMISPMDFKEGHERFLGAMAWYLELLSGTNFKDP